jgi:hypothetical protein
MLIQKGLFRMAIFATLCCFFFECLVSSIAEIKHAYYSCMKSCHPDLSGNDADASNFCIFVNEVYEVLSDPVQRMVNDEIHGYSLRIFNPFLDDSRPRDHVFVDEFSCKKLCKMWLLKYLPLRKILDEQEHVANQEILI